MDIRSYRKASVIIVICCFAGAAQISQAGPLRVHPQNPLYFADDSGAAIYLGGHQIFVDLQAKWTL